MTDFEECKAFLQQDNGDGVSVYDHISEVVLKILTERSSSSLSDFEKLSSIVKEERFVPDAVEGKTEDQVSQSVSSIAAQKALAGRIRSLHLASTNEDGDEVEPSHNVDAVGDIQACALSWEAAGVALGSGDAFKLSLSLSALAGSDDSISELRFWGKLFGRDGNYIVAEGKSSSAELPEGAEEEANAHTYWVSPYVGGEWTQLPALRPDVVVVSRQIRRFLTGNLDAEVCGYPPFPGTEKDYVRCMIAFINGDCAVAPDGVFEKDDDGNMQVSSEETDFNIQDASGWKHTGLPFNEYGLVGPKTEEQDGEEVQLPEGWELSYLRDLSEDDWVVRRTPASVPANKSTFYVLRSSKWPGAYAVGRESGMWHNLYCGYGHPASEKTYSPPMPPAVQSEFDASELLEQGDVTQDPNPPVEEDGEEDADE